MATPPSVEAKQLLEQLVALTGAVKQLAERTDVPVRPFADTTEADRIRQRVAFGYQVLGTLSGRLSYLLEENQQDYDLGRRGWQAN